MSPLLSKVHTELDVPQRLAATTRAKSLHWALFILSVANKMVSPLLIKKKLWATCPCDPLYFLSQVWEHTASFSLIDSRGKWEGPGPTWFIFMWASFTLWVESLTLRCLSEFESQAQCFLVIRSDARCSVSLHLQLLIWGRERGDWNIS